MPELGKKRAARYGFGNLLRGCRGEVSRFVVAKMARLDEVNVRRIEAGEGHQLRRVEHVRLAEVLYASGLMTEEQIRGARRLLLVFMPPPTKCPVRPNFVRAHAAQIGGR